MSNLHRTLTTMVAAGWLLIGAAPARSQFGGTGAAGVSGLNANINQTGTGNAATSTVPTAPTTTGAGIGAIGLDADSAFAGGVDRSGGLGSAPATVGVSPAATTTPLGGARSGFGGGGFGAGGFGGAFGGLGGLGNFFGGQNNGGSDARPPLRTRLRSAVVGPSLTPGQTQAAAGQTIRRASTVQPSNPYGGSGRRFGGVRVDVQQRTATISGKVETPADRRMAELLMRLEPGVSRVENRLQLNP